MAMREEIIRTSIEALEQSHNRLLQEEASRAIHTKGKLKQTPQDVENEAETERELTRITVALSELRKALIDGTLAQEPGVAGLSPSERLPSYSLVDPGPASTGSTSNSLDDEPIFNPFTGSYALRETGFEPGPSGLCRNQKERYETSRSFNSGSDVVDDEPEVHHDSATTQSCVHPVAGDDAIGAQIQIDSAIQDVKTDHSDTRQSGRRRFGYLANVFESWVSPSFRGLLFGRSSAIKSGSNPVSHGGQHVQAGLSNGSTISSTSASSTAFERSNYSLESVMSTSTTPSSLCSVKSKHYSSAKNGLEPVYRPAFSSIEESENDEQRDALQKADSSEIPDTHRKIIVPSYDQKQQQAVIEDSTDLLPDHPDGRQRSQDWALALSLEKEDLADRNQIALSHGLAAELQMQEDKDAAYRQRALDIERDRAEAIRLQELYDQEGNQQKLATLQFMEGLDEAARLHEEERILQTQEQASAEFVRGLYEANKQAEIDQTTQLQHEQMMQHDREYARVVQAELNRGAASQHPVGSQSGESQKPTPPTLTPMPFQRFPSLRDVQRPMPPIVHQGAPINRGSSIAQDTEAQAFKDRALALKLHEAEKTKMAHEDAQWRKDLSAWQRASKAWKASDSALTKTGNLGAKPRRAGHTQEIEEVQAHVGHAQSPSRAFRAPLQSPASHAASVASSNDVADCGICGDSIPKTRLVRPCEHFYYRDCLAGKHSTRSR